MKFRIRIYTDASGVEWFEPQCKNNLLGKWHFYRSSGYSEQYRDKQSALNTINSWKSHLYRTKCKRVYTYENL